MTESGSPFLALPASAWVASNDLAFAIRDGFPVSRGHTLVIPRRHVVDWWSATDDERVAVMQLVAEVKVQLDREYAPAGYNVGFNAGAAAGQTVFHLHVHVIPRYGGDVSDPRGGVRHVLPGGNYLESKERRRVWHGPAHPLAVALEDAVQQNDRINRADVVVSFVMESGLRLLDPVFDLMLERPDASVRILTTDYLGITEAAALRRLLHRSQEYEGRFHARLFAAGNTSFHPKAYLLWSSAHASRHAFVGSANASRTGLVDGHEWTLESQAADVFEEASRVFASLWNHSSSRPLTRETVAAYRQAQRPAGGPAVVAEPLAQPVGPNAVQAEALEALEATRSEGFGAGLVVMATGLGKTWLAAFDSSRPQFRRVLFVAHREEILRQARAVFRQVRPASTTGMLMGPLDERDADVVFATVQTLAQRLDELDPVAFDYVVVDEFHHASAPTYRRLLARLRPRFMLGLTATPDRADGADLLSLCEDNVVYDCGLAAGIERKLLSPFAYHGVPDPVDFRPLPWRNGKFEPTALENAVVSDQRTSAAFREWQRRRGKRTIAFCVSQRHADWMAEHFRSQGVQAAAVHTGPSSAPRADTLQALREGEVEVIFAVDLFNEGLDVPEVDTVLMLRPTSSPVLFLQQLGRGLRRSEQKEHLQVVDFVGNHRTFLLPLRVLAGLADEDLASDEQLRRALEAGAFELPPGCSVDYALEVRRDLLALLPKRTRALEDFVTGWTTEHGMRPTAAQAFGAGRNPTAAKGGWFALLRDLDVLSDDERRVVERYGDVLLDVVKTSMTRSYKMVALRAWLLGDADLTGQPVERNAAVARHLVLRDPRLVTDISSKEIGDVASVPGPAWAAYWRRWPLEHLVGKGVFRLDGDTFGLAVRPRREDAPLLSQLLSELVEWRLAAYLRRSTHQPGGPIRLRVSHSSGRPIIRFDRSRHPELPTGRTRVMADGQPREADFVKIALNVVRDRPNGPNVLPDLLWSWFGRDAGLPGTAFEVEVYREEGEWHMRPHTAVAESDVG